MWMCSNKGFDFFQMILRFKMLSFCIAHLCIKYFTKIIFTLSGYLLYTYKLTKTDKIRREKPKKFV